MNHVLLALPASGAVLALGGCTPYPLDYYPQNNPGLLQPSDEEPQTITEVQQRRMEEERKSIERREDEYERGGLTKIMPEPEEKYPLAERVPNKKGFVINPYTGNETDVKGMRSGAVTRDPDDPDKTRKFRVP